MRKKVQLKARSLLLLLAVLLAIGWVALTWERLPDDSPIATLLGRPSDVIEYTEGTGLPLALACLKAMLSSFLALFLAGVVSSVFLSIGLRSHATIHRLEQLGTITQTLPIQVSVLLIYAILSALCNRARNGCSLSVLEVALLPTVISLFFPPFVYGAKGVADLPFEMKALVRVWGARPGWRIRRIYLPQSVPHLLTGLRVSSAWAIPAVIVCQTYASTTDGGTSSLGYFIIRAFRDLQPGQVFVVSVAATLAGLLVYWLTSLIQQKVELNMHGRAALTESDYHWH